MWREGQCCYVTVCMDRLSRCHEHPTDDVTPVTAVTTAVTRAVINSCHHSFLSASRTHCILHINIGAYILVAPIFPTIPNTSLDEHSESGLPITLGYMVH